MASRGAILFRAYVRSMSPFLFFASVSVRLREGEVNGWKGERSQCIVTLVPMVFLAVRSAILWYLSGILAGFGGFSAV